MVYRDTTFTTFSEEPRSLQADRRFQIQYDATTEPPQFGGSGDPEKNEVQAIYGHGEARLSGVTVKDE